MYMYFTHCWFQSSSKYFVLKIYAAKAIHRTFLWPRKIWKYTLCCLHAIRGNLTTKHKENQGKYLQRFLFYLHAYIGTSTYLM